MKLLSTNEIIFFSLSSNCRESWLFHQTPQELYLDRAQVDSNKCQLSMASLAGFLIFLFYSLTPVPMDHFPNKLPTCQTFSQSCLSGIADKTQSNGHIKSFY